MADPGDAADPDPHPEPRGQRSAGRHAAAEAALRGEARPVVPGAAAHPGTGDRHGRPARAYPHAGSAVGSLSTGPRIIASIRVVEPLFCSLSPRAGEGWGGGSRSESVPWNCPLPDHPPQAGEGTKTESIVGER